MFRSSTLSLARAAASGMTTRSRLTAARGISQMSGGIRSGMNTLLLVVALSSFHTSARFRMAEDKTPAPVTPSATPATPSEGNGNAKETALKLLEAVPGQDKAYNVLMGTAAASILFGKELIPFTADVVYAIPFSLAIYVLYSQVGPMVGDLVKQVMAEDEKIWNDSKSKAEARLQQEIHQITGSGVTDLVQVTENLFDYAREVTELEAQAYEHEQLLNYNAKAKQILDDWVRYEGAIREKEQRRIAEEVLAKIQKAIQDPKFQEKYMAQCLDDVEAAVSK